MKLALRRAIKAPHLRVSPVLRGGRGLKQLIELPLCLARLVSPVLRGGRGLKLSGTARMRTTPGKYRPSLGAGAD